MNRKQTSYSLGVDLGSASTKVFLLSDRGEPVYSAYRLHYGKPYETAIELLMQMDERPGRNDIVYGAVTGAHAGALGDAFPTLGDIPAIEKGLSLLCPTVRSAIEIGSQSARFLTKERETAVPHFAMSEGCASGTGSFFEDQMLRLGLSIEDYSAFVAGATEVPRISGRCSVFAKTDIIHRQQEGVATADILLGLCYATVRNLKATIIRNRPIHTPVALCGGIVRNTGVVRAVKEIFELSDDDFFVSDDHVFMQAAGAAQYAREQRFPLPIEVWISALQAQSSADSIASKQPQLAPLHLLPGTVTADPLCPPILEPTHCSLGIDVGSTSTNLVLTDPSGRILDIQYLRTKGDPQSVVKEGLSSIQRKWGDRAVVKAVGVTGSGRYLIGKMVGADAVIDEITAQAKAAVRAVPDADTVFEIGGQDSKFISLQNGAVADFQMNKICAAGTGSFIEEQAGRLHIPIEEYGNIALSAASPADLGERCTVFIGKNIASSLEKGVPIPDILAGLCYSIVHNYLNKVVGNKRVGNRIVLQGGVCYNPAVVAAFQSVYGDRVTVSPCFSISGAYGVALLASEQVRTGETTFRGFDLSGKGNEISEATAVQVHRNREFFGESKRLFYGDYTGKRDPNKQTVGIPYVLAVHKLFPMMKSFFEDLGFNVLLSEESNERTIERSQRAARSETCYPVKLIYGHMAELADKGVDYIFLPCVQTMKHEHSKVHHNYGCVFMQSAPQMVFDALGLADQGIRLLSPVFSLDFGKQALAKAMIGVGVSLGKNKALCAKALLKGAMAVRKFMEGVESLGEELLHSLQPNEKALVLVTREYGLADPVLNMGIPKALLDRGYKILTLSHLPAHDLDISEEYENLYWPFGQHILTGAKLIKNHPNLYAVYLTNHGCGPDTMIAHLFRQEMGDKPYLNIEVDEHFSAVGVITRIEAFINSLENAPTAVESKANFFDNLPVRSIDMPKSPCKETPLYLPHLHPYSRLVAHRLCREGYRAQTLPPTTSEELAIGKSRSISKEYMSFTATIGTAIRIAQQEEGYIQLMIPATEGAETDGLYGRILYDMLEKENLSHLRVVSPASETLPFTDERCDRLFLDLLAGDILLSAAPSRRKSMLASWSSKKPLSVSTLVQMARSVAQDRDLCDAIALVGEPMCLYNSGINDGMFDSMESDGHRISYMPLSEYFCFLWKDRCETAKEHRIVDGFIEQMQQVSVALGQASPFAWHFKDLMALADRSLSHFAGGNGRYRLAKLKDMQARARACLVVASLYENTQTVLDLVGGESDCPTLTLSLEGLDDGALQERLRSFLFYVRDAQNAERIPIPS